MVDVPPIVAVPSTPKGDVGIIEREGEQRYERRLRRKFGEIAALLAISISTRIIRVLRVRLLGVWDTLFEILQAWRLQIPVPLP